MLKTSRRELFRTLAGLVGVSLVPSVTVPTTPLTFPNHSINPFLVGGPYNGGDSIAMNFIYDKMGTLQISEYLMENHIGRAKGAVPLLRPRVPTVGGN